MEPTITKIYWGVNQGLVPGAFIDRIDGEFIPWEILQEELNTRGISQCPKYIPTGSKVVLETFYDKQNWLVNIVNENNEYIGSVWIGGNPMDNWSQDGYVRIGKTINDETWEVYQTLARYSDGSYRIVHSI